MYLDWEIFQAGIPQIKIFQEKEAGSASLLFPGHVANESVARKAVANPPDCALLFPGHVANESIGEQ